MDVRRRSGLRAGGALGAIAMLAALGAAPSASAQTWDARWLPWLGCWAPVGAAETDDLLCLRPAEALGSVEALRVSGGEVVSREVLWADGVRHDTEREGCTGWEEGRFSSDVRRVYMTSEHVCEGGMVQEGGAIMALASPDEWLDVRVTGMGGERTAWVQRYRLVDQETAAAAGFGDILEADRAWNARAARLVASTSLEVDDVIEAAGQVPPEAVTALLAERADRLDLDAAELIRMSEAGVPDDVIDVAVAVSYPDKFALAAGGPEEARGQYRGYRSFMSPFGFDPFYGPWSLRYGYGYGYGLYGYYPYGGWGYGGYGYRPTVVIVDRAAEHGRVVRGRGYTRSRGGTAGPSGSPAYVPSGQRGQPGVSSGGSASGGSGAARPSTGRKAKPRGGR